MSMNKKELVKLISYMVMGDGGLYVTGRSKNAKFIMNMREDNRDYIMFCKEVLENVTGCAVYSRKDYNTDGFVRRPQLRLESRNHPLLTSIRDRVYTGKYKGLDPHALKMLDAQALAILYMCDGSLYTDKADGSKKGLVNDSYSVNLNMKRLSYGDQVLLKKALRDRLGLEWNVNRHGKYYYLRLRNKDLHKFMNMVEPHILPSFKYKLVRLAPEKDDDIVCTTQECVEVGRNDRPLPAKGE